MSAALRPLWSRLRNRFRYGLAMQEALDRLARAGVVIYPYFVVEEPVVERPEVDALGQGLELRLLRAEEAHLVAGVKERPRDQAAIREKMSGASCAAVLDDGELLGYSWFSRSGIVGPKTTRPLCELPADGAYLFDAYVLPKARGRKVAVNMRHRVHRLLASDGVGRCYSVTLAFNRSSRRFKSRLGARELELRLLLRLGSMTGIDLRLGRRAAPLSTPAWQLVPAARKP